jgi:hypothetical protein
VPIPAVVSVFAPVNAIWGVGLVVGVVAAAVVGWATAAPDVGCVACCCVVVVVVGAVVGIGVGVGVSGGGGLQVPTSVA